MSTGRISIFTLGRSGVILDANSLDPESPDDALRSAQNATHDPTRGRGGALVKRQGLKRFNLAFAGGSILGGLPMGVAGTGGAPTVGGGGSTGDPTGTGNGVGAPGGTYDGGAIVFPSQGADAFTGGTETFGGAQLIAIGRHDTNVVGIGGTAGVGWYLSSKNFADVASLITSPGPPGENCRSQHGASIFTPRNSAKSGDDVLGGNGYTYYPVAISTTSYVVMPIRRTNGYSDYAVTTIPLNAYASAGTRRMGLSGMHWSDLDGLIYLAVWDKAAGPTGRVLMLDPATNVLTELNLGTPASTPAEYSDLPTAPVRFGSYLYFGTYHNTDDVSATIRVYSASAGASALDFDGGLDPRYANMTTSWATDVLYFGTQWKGAGTAARAQILVRQPGKAVGAADAWATVDIDLGDTPANLNFYSSMIEFNGDIYVAWYNPGDKARIIKCVPGVVGGFTLFSTTVSVWNSASAATLAPLILHKHDGVLYAFGHRGEITVQVALSSVDGTTWVDQSANFDTSEGGLSIWSSPAFIGMDQ